MGDLAALGTMQNLTYILLSENAARGAVVWKYLLASSLLTMLLGLEF